MKKLKSWIEELRLRTLPLSFSLIIMGSSLAAQHGAFNWCIFGMALLTTLFLQCLSNVANDYGDAVSGADADDRVGPQRAIQTGALSRGEIFWGMIVLALLSLVSGLLLLYVAYPRLHSEGVLTMLVIGLLCIAAAINYTVGKRPYGYRGLGDASVFVFFGIVGVLGSNVLYLGRFEPSVLLPAASIGFLSMAVLNMNNMRDYESDKRTGKKTLIVVMGQAWGRRYQNVIVVGAFVVLAIYIGVFGAAEQWASFAVLPLFLRHLTRVNKGVVKLDGELKKVSIATLFLTVLFALGTMASICA